MTYNYLYKIKNILYEALPNYEIVAGIFIGIFIIVKTSNILVAYLTKRVVTAIVLGKERVYYPAKLKSIYLVYTSEGVFRKEDSWAYLAFGSSSTYGKINKGDTYEFTIYNFRIPLFSSYPNIIKIKKIQDL
jgi:hypothetical protein